MQQLDTKIIFEDVSEFRMSWYNVAERTKVRGKFNLDFGFGLQDIYAIDEVNGFVYLCSLQILKDGPAFEILRVDLNNKSVMASEKIRYSCKNIEIMAGVCVVTATGYDQSADPAARVARQVKVSEFPLPFLKYKAVLTNFSRP